MAQKLLGKPVADNIYEWTRGYIYEESKRNDKYIPTLALVHIEESDANLTYEKQIKRNADKLGIKTETFTLNDVSCEYDIESFIRELNWHPNYNYINSVMLFRPFPTYISERKLSEVMRVYKDIDGVGTISLAGIFSGRNKGFVPATASACMEILKHYDINLRGKRVAVLGRSLTVGKPVAMMAMDKGATVTICHSQTGESDLKDIIENSEIIISAIGRAKFLNDRFNLAGKIIIDVGINLDEKIGLCGDLDPAVAETTLSYTPVPGGVGTVTTAMILHNAAVANEKRFYEKI